MKIQLLAITFIVYVSLYSVDKTYTSIVLVLLLLFVFVDNTIYIISTSFHLYAIINSNNRYLLLFYDLSINTY